jgi:hypothetical protein
MVGQLDKAKFEAAFSRSQQAATTIETTEQDPRVQELWTLIEPALEDKGRFEAEIRSHLTEATTEIKSWRSARSLAMGFTIGVIVLSVLSLTIILFCPLSPLKLGIYLSDNVQIALLAGHFAVIFGLTAIIMRGAFTPSRREDGGLPMPESAKILAETIAKIIGTGKT